MSLLRFLRNWTLPAAMTTGTMVYLLFHFTPALQPVCRWYAPYNNYILPVFMFFILFVTFCKVDFRRMLPVRWHLWVGIQQVVLVFTIMAVILGFRLVPGSPSIIMLEAILVCIIGPCASAAPVVTAKLGGNLEEMTTYTFLSNFITAALIPLCFPIIEPSTQMSFLRLLLKILYQVSIVLLVPMLLAFIVKHTMHRLHSWITGIKDLSYYLWGCSLTIVTGTTAMNIVDAWSHTPLMFILSIAAMALILCIVQFATGRFIGHYFHATVEAGQGLGQKNTAFAIWIATAFLNPLSSVGPGCYILWQNIINSVEIWMVRRQGKEMRT